MSENANNIPLDDEDILDLTVVAEPGKQPASKADGPPEPGDPADFGADLDALLDSLGADASAAPVEPVAAPIADQTPVDHAVDPDEEMAMPEMSDIDSLLAELGADVSAAPAQADAAPSGPAEGPAEQAGPAVKPSASAPMPEFDSILAQAQAAEAQKAGQEAVKAPSGPAPAVARPEAETARPAPVKEAVAATPDGPPEEGEEALDLNELDALLDDILATAPEVSSPSAAETTEAAPPAAESPSGKDSPDGDAAVVIPVPDQAIMPASEELSALMERVRRLEESVDVLESGEMSESMIEGFIDAKLHAWTESLFEPGSPVMDRICNEIRGRFAEGDLSESLEKMAAAAAAKVIREEIAGLMQEDG